MRKGRKESANDESARQSAVQSSFGVILKILRHGEAESHQRGVDDSINNAVKFVLLPEEEDKQDQSLGALFHNWSKDHCACHTPRLLTLGHRGDGQSAHRIEYVG